MLTYAFKSMSFQSWIQMTAIGDALMSSKNVGTKTKVLKT